MASRADGELTEKGRVVGGPPNYRKVSTKANPNPSSSCLDCKFVTDNRCRAYCAKYSTRVNPWYVCDEWKPRTA